MRFSTVFTLAFAALACAQELPLSPRADKHHVEKAHEKAAHEKAAAKAAAAKAAAAKHHSEEEARKHKATSTVATSTHSASGGVSTKCAAIARRSSRYEVDLDDISIAKRDTTCQVTGYLTDPSETTVEYNVAQQRCANTCTCRDDGKCKTFTFTAERTVDGVARGQCTMYTETLSNMGFTAGTDPSTGSSSTYTSRSCYRKGVPVPSSGVQTSLVARATAPPSISKRSADADAEVNVLSRRAESMNIDADLILAMEQL